MQARSYQDFIKEASSQDLHRIYLAIKPESGHRWWNYKGFAGEKFFKKISIETYQDMEIDRSMPILTYNSEVVKKLLDENLIDPNNVYNLPEFIGNSGSKKTFHELLKGDPNIPETCYKQKDALKMQFPIIAKPAEGHSGIGIQVFKNQKELEAVDSNKFDVYSKYIDKKSEHRIICFKGEPISWMQRFPMNDKAKSGDGKGDEQMDFKYVKRNPGKLPKKAMDLITRMCDIFKDLPYICFDLMEDQKGKLWVIESNSQPGVPYDITVTIYLKIFKDFYKREVNTQCRSYLRDIASQLDQKTLELNPDRFEIKD